jgi:hypothetical protein
MLLGLACNKHFQPSALNSCDVLDSIGNLGQFNEREWLEFAFNSTEGQYDFGVLLYLQVYEMWFSIGYLHSFKVHVEILLEVTYAELIEVLNKGSVFQLEDLFVVIRI